MSRSLMSRLARVYDSQPDRFDRRELLKNAVAASAGFLVSESTAFCRSMALTRSLAEKRRVIVVGAGFAGLACAYELAEAGYAVTIFEARNRFGGRVNTLRDFVAGKTVEGGGEFIGTNHPTWMAFVRRFSLTLLDVAAENESKNPIFLGGKQLTAKEARQLYEEMKHGALLLTRAAQPINADEPWKSANAKMLDRQSLADAVSAMKFGSMGKRGMEAEFTHDMGLEPRRAGYLSILTTLKAHGLQRFWTETETHRCLGGNSRLAEKFADRVGQNRLHLQTPVAAIQVRENAVIVQTADGRRHEADDVVLALPPSVWHKIKFDPPLPAELQIQMGSNIKYLAAVKERFWRKGGLSANSLSDGEMGWTWEATEGQPGQQGAVLASFAGGPAAQACRRRTSADRREMYRREFENVLPGFGSNFAKDSFRDWPSEPWTMAGYSLPGPGQLTTFGPILRQGLGRLHFAGEHTSKFRGYMEGALHSGVSVARNLAIRDGLVKP